MTKGRCPHVMRFGLAQWLRSSVGEISWHQVVDKQLGSVCEGPPEGQCATWVLSPTHNPRSKWWIDDTVRATLTTDTDMTFLTTLLEDVWRRTRASQVTDQFPSWLLFRDQRESWKSGGRGRWRLATLSPVFTALSLCVCSLRETENRKVTEMKVPGSVCHGWDDGRTATLCPRQIRQARRTSECHERCTAVLIACLMTLSGDPRLYVCQAPNAFICVSPCGSIFGPFLVHFGSISGPFWVHFGSKNRYLDKNQYLHKNWYSDKNRCLDKNWYSDKNRCLDKNAL